MSAPRPYTLVAELTYRCPLRCAYCSNPTEYAPARPELSTEDWLGVLEAAADLGVVQVHFTGGEPLLHSGLEALVERARTLDLYTNLITSAVTLDRPRLEAVRDAGLDHVQVSFQSLVGQTAREVAGLDAYAQKVAACRWAKELGLLLTINVVLHRDNICEAESFIRLAEELGADRLELAHTQLLGWALENRDALLPSKEAIESVREVAARAAARLEGKMTIASVLPDYWADRPRACMDGWARRFIVVAPDGLALPCHAARGLPLPFEDVRDRPLSEQWRNGAAFTAYRGEEWMKEPCRSCESRSRDHGGCRCQAFALAGDAREADPACAKAPAHGAVLEARGRTDLPGPRRTLRRLAIAPAD